MSQLNNIFVITCLCISGLISSTTALATGPGDPWFDNWIKLEAERISSRCQNTWCDGQLDEVGGLLEGHSPALTRNEIQILFEAAGLYAREQYQLTEQQRNGILRLLKSLAFNEVEGNGYWDKTPRHFYTLPLMNDDTAVTSRFYSASYWPLNLLQHYGDYVPIAFGDDLAFCADPETGTNCVGPYTLGLGIWQLTTNLSYMDTVLRNELNTYAACGSNTSYNLQERELLLLGNPGNRCGLERFDVFRENIGASNESVQIVLNFDRWLHDPLYNLYRAVDLIRFKQMQYSDEGYSYRVGDNVIVGALEGIKREANNLYDWAQIGRYVETINGNEGWIPIFLGMQPYQSSPQDPVDLAALNALNAEGAYIEHDGETIYVRPDLIAKQVYADTWSLNMEKVRSQQQFASEVPRTYGTVDSVIIIDSSGSMGTNDRENERLNAANTYVDISSARDRVGIIDFHSSSTLIHSMDNLLGTRGSATRTDIETLINNITAGGGTDIAESLALACSTLSESWALDVSEQHPVAGDNDGSTMVEHIQELYVALPINNVTQSDERRERIAVEAHSVNSKKVAILLTDGESSTPYADSAACFYENGWVLYTLGFGSANDSLLQSLAESTGGYYVEVSEDLTDLTCRYQQIRSHAAGEQPRECVSASIQQGQTIALNPIEVEMNLAQVTFTSSWPGSDVIMTLYSPSGRVITRDTIAPDVYHENGPRSEQYTIELPEAGWWQIELYGADIPEDFEPVVVATTTQLAEANQIPIARAGGPYSIELGESLVLNASASTDIDGTLVRYTWDIGSDGVIEFDSANAITEFTPTSLMFDSLTLTVFDNDGYTASSQSSIQVAEATTPEIEIDPASADCLLRYSPEETERSILLSGNNLPYPRSSQNLQFRRTDTGAESIYLGMEVNWIDNQNISLDVSLVESYLWPDSPRVPLQVRLTDYDPDTGGQIPLSDWSETQIVVASRQASCENTAEIISLVPTSPSCVLRNSPNINARTLTLSGLHFPSPRTHQNLQFRRIDNGATSIHLGMEVNWLSDSSIQLDLQQVSHFLWENEATVPVQVRITDYDFNTGWQVPVSEWSTEHSIIASDAAYCN